MKCLAGASEKSGICWTISARGQEGSKWPINRRVKNAQKVDHKGRQNNDSSGLNINKLYMEYSSRGSTGPSLKKEKSSQR